MIALTMLAALAADAVPVESRVADVTLYASTALVHRSATISGAGTYVVRGLPASMDAANVRVRCTGGDVIDVEVRRRTETKAPSERVQALRERVAKLERDVKARADDRDVAQAVLEHVKASMQVAPSSSAALSGSKGTGAWSAHWQFLTEELARATKAVRAALTALDEANKALASARTELGEASGGGEIALNDVIVEVAGAAPSALDVDYFVGGCRWTPRYDVRAARDLSGADVAYRAQVVQTSGEDWTDVAMALSTAQPSRGAEGPDARPIRLALLGGGDGFATGRLSAKVEKRAALEDKAKADAEVGADDEPVYASVEAQGTSVRFQLPRRETILSRDEPTLVLVGAAKLAIETERHCVPALDPTVWLRARARNTSPWVLLPGVAAVFLGNEYFGEASVATVQPGQELVLHLGADPSVTVEREQVEDLVKEPGFLSSRASKVDAWRVHVENHGALGANPDGSVDVIVRESLPKSRDERVKVELSKAEPSPSDAERWKQDRSDKGFVTWVLRVPRAGSTELVWQRTITHPKDLAITRP